MTVREQLLGISGLNIAKRLTTMGDSELNEYVNTLNSFAEEFPAQEENIKNALGEKDYLSFSKNLAVVKDLLVDIHADTLADDCLTQINELTSVNHEKLEAYMTKFLSVLTMLSIDIQMAMLNDGNVRKDKRPANYVNKPGAEKRSILAVDDSAFILGILKNILQVGYKFSCVISGDDALRYLQNHRPDLFILDIEMPKLDGYELVKKIRENGHTAPVIFLTGNGTKEYVIRAVKAGAVDFITKPVDKDQVLARIAKHI
jgi:PleD family two-component response regulator